MNETVIQHTDDTMPDHYQSTYIRLWRKEGILHGVFAKDLNITLEIARQCVEARITFSQGVSYPLLIDMRGVRSVDKPAREYLAKEGAQLVKAGALIIGSMLTQMIGNLFLHINKPQVPTKLFTNEKKAKKWLKQFL